MRLSISETANLFGISVRTLHYYDEIGLLKPSETSNAGYRYYTDEAIILLQQILFYRELDFPLKESAAMLNNPQYDRQKALLNHHSLLVSKRERLDALIHLVEQTMGGKAMTKPKISSVPPPDLKRQYAEEARKRWGHTAEYAQSKQNEDSRPDSEQADAEKEADAIFSAFAKCRAGAADLAGRYRRRQRAEPALLVSVDEKVPPRGADYRSANPPGTRFSSRAGAGSERPARFAGAL